MDLDFKSIIDAGLAIRGLEDYVEILGRFAVKFYPKTKMMQVSTSKPFRCVSTQDLIEMARGEYWLYHAKRRKDYKLERLRLFKKSPKCFLCKQVIETIEEASVDHWIPLSRGGTNNRRNLRLAHIRCNNEKGDKIL